MKKMSRESQRLFEDHLYKLNPSDNFNVLDFIRDQPIPCCVNLLSSAHSYSEEAEEGLVALLCERLTFSQAQILETAFEYGVRGIGITTILGHLECLEEKYK